MLKLSTAKSEARLDVVSPQAENDPHSTPKYSQKHFEQGLRMRGRELVSLCKKMASTICDLNSDLKYQQKIIFYVSFVLPIYIVASSFFVSTCIKSGHKKCDSLL